MRHLRPSAVAAGRFCIELPAFGDTLVTASTAAADGLLRRNNNFP
jgi:hypothetical protein